MKKVFGLLFVAGLFVFASCNNTDKAATEGETVETVIDETTVVEDVDTTTAISVDTTATPIDSSTVVE